MVGDLITDFFRVTGHDLALKEPDTYFWSFFSTLVVSLLLDFRVVDHMRWGHTVYFGLFGRFCPFLALFGHLLHNVTHCINLSHFGYFEAIF